MKKVCQTIIITRQEILKRKILEDITLKGLFKWRGFEKEWLSKTYCSLIADRILKTCRGITKFKKTVLATVQNILGFIKYILSPWLKVVLAVYVTCLLHWTENVRNVFVKSLSFPGSSHLVQWENILYLRTVSLC